MELQSEPERREAKRREEKSRDEVASRAEAEAVKLQVAIEIAIARRAPICSALKS